MEGLSLAVRRAEVQREISQVAVERERGGLAHEKQAAQAAAAEAAQRDEQATSEAVAAERRHGEAQSRELAISRAELHAQQQHIQTELTALLQSREAQLEASEARTQQAHAVFREAVASQLERDAAVNQTKSGAAGGGTDGKGGAAGGISDAISELRAALVASFSEREAQLVEQVDRPASPHPHATLPPLPPLPPPPPCHPCHPCHPATLPPYTDYGSTHYGSSPRRGGGRRSCSTHAGRCRCYAPRGTRVRQAATMAAAAAAAAAAARRMSLVARRWRARRRSRSSWRSVRARRC